MIFIAGYLRGPSVTPVWREAPRCRAPIVCSEMRMSKERSVKKEAKKKPLLDKKAKKAAKAGKKSPSYLDA
jgi:hypothetical protein